MNLRRIFDSKSSYYAILSIAQCGRRQVVRPKLPNQFHARFFRKLTKQTITKNQFKGVLFDTPLFFHPFGKQEKRAFLTNF